MQKFSRAAAYISILASFLAPLAAAQGVGSVVESRPITPGQVSTLSPSSPPSNSNNDALQLLLDQNRQLQAEVQALRGMVEEQGFELRKLQRDSLNRYTDTDERLRTLETGAVGTASTAPVTSNPIAATPNTSISNTAPTNDSGIDATNLGAVPASPTVGSTRPIAPRTTNMRNTSNRGTLQPAVLSEQQLYQMAYDSVINSNFERSIAEFDQYLSIYPEGRFVTNGHYWKGLAYLNLNQYAEARVAFEIILNEYQDSAKLPDAMYGLAQAYQGLGNIPQARQLLNDIKRRFPNTGVANLADTRLLSLD